MVDQGPQLGIFLDLRNPPQWHRPWPEHYRATIELVVGAEQLGADSVWLSEHHFFTDGYLPQPLTFAAALAARTERIRLGTAIVVAPLRHATHLAEEAALVDVLSNGRLELGLGAGWSEQEYRHFGADIARKYSLTDATVTRLRALWEQGAVIPPPVQQPVPLWLGYQGPQGARRAGRLGVGLLSLLPELLPIYRQGLAEGGHDPDSARMGGVLDIIVADDPDAALDRILPHYAHQRVTYANARKGRPGDATGVEQVEAGLRATYAETGHVPGLRVMTADQAGAAIRAETAGLPVRHVYFWASVGGMPDDLVQRHLELLFTVVKPALSGESR
jgi:alkanesulfonate monooxygenase SsuD/methylene tetrahydromethanopterin reductase-like flavin-dependent oxidoreductase (luciferase family)